MRILIASSPVPHNYGCSLQTKGGQKLHYNVTVQFSLLNGFVSQRHTLKLWESIRKLEKRLQKEREAISDGNQISIDNEELPSGVIYTFQVVGIDQTGTASQEQHFTLTYRGKNLQASVVQDGSSSTGDVSLLLLGSEVSYPDVPFTVTAKVIFCKAKNNYKVGRSATLRNKLFDSQPVFRDHQKESSSSDRSICMISHD